MTRRKSRRKKRQRARTVPRLVQNGKANTATLRANPEPANGAYISDLGSIPKRCQNIARWVVDHFEKYQDKLVSTRFVRERIRELAGLTVNGSPSGDVSMTGHAISARHLNLNVERRVLYSKR